MSLFMSGMMRLCRFGLLLGLLAGLVAGGPAAPVRAGSPDIPDPNLEAAFRDALNKPFGVISDTDLRFIIELNAAGRDIVDLSGLEHCVNMASLYLNDNRISDISVLPKLHSPEGGTRLREIDLSNNLLTDISPLAGLVQLEMLNLSGNQLSDITPLHRESGRFALTWLNLSRNQISDLASLKRLTDLKYLFLGSNQISDISPLLANTGLGIGDVVNLHDNPLSSASQDEYIPALEKKWVDVLWSLPPPPPPPVITPVPPKPEVPVSFPCPNLEALLRETVAKPAGTVYQSDLYGITALNGDNRQISDISGLEYCVDLKNLYLGGNAILSLAPLADLTSLVTLGLENNRIADIACLEEMGDLSRLYLGGNQISDIGPLAQLDKLMTLRLQNNRIADISPLLQNSGLGGECRVNLDGNPLSDAARRDHLPALAARGVEITAAPVPVAPSPAADEFPVAAAAGGFGIGLVILGGIIAYFRYRRRA